MTDGIQIEAARFAGRSQRDLHPSVVGRLKGNRNRSVDRDRQDEALVVVGVLADQIYAARGPGNERHAAEATSR